jgi:hypothetical protein
VRKNLYLEITLAQFAQIEHCLPRQATQRALFSATPPSEFAGALRSIRE